MERKGDAYSVNSSDQVVGRSTLCSKVNPDDSCEGASYHAFLWENGSIADLQTLILPGSGFTVNNAVNINDRGEIAGYGTLSNGDNHVILLIPCDGNRPDVEGCDYSLVDAATWQHKARHVPMFPAQRNACRSGGGAIGFTSRASSRRAGSSIKQHENYKEKNNELENMDAPVSVVPNLDFIPVGPRER